jgi:hypothetical protein
MSERETEYTADQPATVAGIPESRALDAQIAERVFGWKRDDPIYDGPEPLFVRPEGGSRFLSELPRYSADIAAAWTVVERCTAIGPFGYRDVNGLPIATWFMAHFEAAGLWAHTATEAAEKICRIALLAIEGRPVVRR